MQRNGLLQSVKFLSWATSSIEEIASTGPGISFFQLYVYKDIVVSLLVRRAERESTIGAAFFSSTLTVNNATVKYEIWNTAGQERYHSLAPMYYRGAATAIIVYDITSSDSFAKAKKWVQER